MMPTRGSGLFFCCLDVIEEFMDMENPFPKNPSFLPQSAADPGIAKSITVNVEQLRSLSRTS